METDTTQNDPAAEKIAQFYAPQPSPDADNSETPPAGDEIKPDADATPPEGDGAAKKDDEKAVDQPDADKAGDDDPDGSPSGDEKSDDDPAAVVTVEEFAEQFDVDPEAIPSLKIKRNIRGKEVEISIADALESHDKVAAADDYLSEAKEKGREMVKESEAKTQEISVALQSLGKVLEIAEGDLVKDYKAIDWNDLREKDPAEWSAKQAEFKERQDRIQLIKQGAADSIQSVAERSAQEQEKALKDRIPEEREKVLKILPDWSDEKVMKREAGEIIDFLSDQGYTERDRTLITHSGRDLGMAVKAMRYDRIMAKAESEPGKKKVVKVPKVMKPGPDKPADANAKPAGEVDRVTSLYGD